MMVTAIEYGMPGPTLRTGSDGPASDALLFALIDELGECEKRREALLNRLPIEEADADREAAAKAACDAARALYSRIAAIKPTTVAGVLRQLELAASGWVAPSTVPTAMAGLHEIARRPAPLKVGKLPPVPAMSAARRTLSPQDLR